MEIILRCFSLDPLYTLPVGWHVTTSLDFIYRAVVEVDNDLVPKVGFALKRPNSDFTFKLERLCQLLLLCFVPRILSCYVPFYTVR